MQCGARITHVYAEALEQLTVAHAEAEHQPPAAQLSDRPGARCAQKRMPEVDIGDVGADDDPRGGGCDGLRNGQGVGTRLVDQHCIESAGLGVNTQFEQLRGRFTGGGGEHDAERGTWRTVHGFASQSGKLIPGISER